MRLLFTTFMMLLTASQAIAATVHPTQAADLKKVTAMFRAPHSLGTSVILHSSPKGTILMTNEHVCEAVGKDPGYIYFNHHRYAIKAKKTSEFVDLCLIRISEDLKTDIEVSPTPPKFGDSILSGGYPQGMPLLPQRGYVSDKFNMQTKQDPKLVLLTSVLVEGGDSGSGVFDSKGRLVGMMQAFRSTRPGEFIGFGLAVPQEYIVTFLTEEAPTLPWVEVSGVAKGP